MTSSNSNPFQQSTSDSFCSIEMLKSFVENPIQLPNGMFKFEKMNFVPSLEYDFMVKYLQDVYNPPDHDLQLSRHKQTELQTMRQKERHIQNVGIKEPMKKVDMMWEDDRNVQMNRLTDKNLPGNPYRVIPRNLTETMGKFGAPKPVHLVYPYQNLAYPTPPIVAMNNKMVHPKRRMDMNLYPDVLKKKVRSNLTPKTATKNVKYIEVIDDDSEVPPPVTKNRKKDKKITQTKSITRTGLKNIKTKKMSIEIIDSPEIIPKATMMEEEKEGDRETTTNATNLTNFDEINENEKDGLNGHTKEDTFDFGDLNIDDLGIKILEEVFLCNKCQKQIPQKETEKGFKEICQLCSKVKNPKVGLNKKNKSSKEEQNKKVHEPSLNTEKERENKEKYDILAPIYKNRDFYEDTTNVNLLEPSQIQKITLIGKEHQTIILPLNLYGSVQKKKLKKLWTPERLELSIYEKFRNDVNGKNSVYLIDEEITEILVRHKYNVEQALVWSMKSNPEFQYYVKRSANRRRNMTRGFGRNYSSIYE